MQTSIFLQNTALTSEHMFCTIYVTEYIERAEAVQYFMEDQMTDYDLTPFMK